MTHGEPHAPVTVTSSIDAASFSIAVHNLGAPIPEQAQAGIFQPMTRGPDTSNADRSVGLGLFIVREIARAHGGSALVKSTLQDGTTFNAVFPRSGVE
jgi:sigma-B regulation protein RsbU (phosphoserine phosphatase)